jgi:hypothetical protein
LNDLRVYLDRHQNRIDGFTRTSVKRRIVDGIVDFSQRRVNLKLNPQFIGQIARSRPTQQILTVFRKRTFAFQFTHQSGTPVDLDKRIRVDSNRVDVDTQRLCYRIQYDILFLRSQDLIALSVR